MQRVRQELVSILEYITADNCGLPRLTVNYKISKYI